MAKLRLGIYLWASEFVKKNIPLLSHHNYKNHRTRKNLNTISRCVFFDYKRKKN